jgi:tRNA pseudouridine38-40 synthase
VNPPSGAELQRLAMGVSYHGRAYHGWQSQLGLPTVQDTLQHALGAFAAQRVQVVCAGRTDAGVHGVGQVVHFDTALQREAFSWVRGTNRFLPPDVAVQWVQTVPRAFHARAAARGRRYAYWVWQSPVRPALQAGQVGWVFRPLQVDALHAAARHLLGTHDFSAFRAAECQAHSPVKTITEIVISRHAGLGAVRWCFEFEADAFLHHMIRNLMGSLLRVAQGLQSPQWLADVLASRQRSLAAPTFAADGLYFLGPRYAPEWGLPERPTAFDGAPQMALALRHHPPP